MFTMRLKKLSARSGFEPENHKHEACHATSSTIWVARYGLRKAQIMYNCGSCFNDVIQRSPSICDSATSRGPRDTSFFGLRLSSRRLLANFKYYQTDVAKDVQAGSQTYRRPPHA